MEEIIKSFHVDWKLMIAQAVNFFIVLAVLWHFVSKPLIKLMQNRTMQIKEGLEKSEKIKEEYGKLDDLRNEKIREGRVESEKIIKNTNLELADIKQEKLKEIQEKTKEIIKEAKEKIEGEKIRMQKEAREELAELVLIASNKVAGGSATDKLHRDLIEGAIKEIESNRI